MTFTARLALAVALLLAPLTALAQDKAAVLVTSSGQALDAFTVKTLLGRAGVANDYDLRITDQGKGFGAAGITAETEIQRTTALLDAAKAAGVKIIGVHIGGAERRQGLSEQFVQLVAPRADSLVVWKTGNADGYFDSVAAEKDIPVTLIDKLTEVGPVLAGEVAPQ
jgi:hypothetical protein